MKNLILALSVFAFTGVTTISCNDDDDNNTSMVEFNTLPNTAVEFVNTYFAGIDIVNVEKYSPAQSNGVMYEVNFRDGSEIEFDQAGNWVKVEAADNFTIPTGFILPVIVTYVNTNYPLQGINQIEKNSTGFEVELTNDMDLIFDATGNFIRIKP